MNSWLVTPSTAEKMEANKLKNEMALKEFQKTLPNVDEWLTTLPNLEFFALCPNGKRIPVKEICDEYLKDPTGLAYRTFDDRLVLVIQAIHPELKEPYWNQAFYLSTGESSGKGGTWLPFNGIVAKLETSRLITHYYPRFFQRNRTPEEHILYSTSWFSKAEFCAPQNRTFPVLLGFGASLENVIIFELRNAYGDLYLPEGNNLHCKSRFDRFGTISYALASHALGGAYYIHNEYNIKNTKSTFFPNIKITNKEPTTSEEILAHILHKNSPLQSCFIEMAKTYPISPPNKINAYIDSHYALSYMNAFRQEKIFPPGLLFANVPMKTLVYSLPILDFSGAISRFVKDAWKDWKLGKKTIGEIQEIFLHPQRHVQEYFKQHRKNEIMPNEPEFQWNVLRNFASKPEHAKYYGGRKTRHRRSSKLHRSRKNRST
jgi:hypothetical protein